MKKIVILTGALFLTAGTWAQDDIRQAAADAAQAIAEAPVEPQAAPKPCYWANSLAFDLGFNQTGFANWAAGGSTTFALAAGVDGKANYAKDLMTWDNRLQMLYGIIWSDDKPKPQKNNDRIYLESKWKYKTGKESKWSYSAGFDFRSQFSETWSVDGRGGQDYYEEPTLKSAIMSPAYINLGVGMDWKPGAWFDLSLSPLTGGMTVVWYNDNTLRRNYGMKPNPDGSYQPVLFQLGTQLKANAKFSINDKFHFETQLVAFYDYLFDYKSEYYTTHRPFPVRINWDNKISWQISRLFRIGLDTWLIYDPLVQNDSNAPRGVQFKEFASLNFTYTIANPLAIEKAKKK
ncbi:MAG: DUF3078 domain-containing protein [Bacteroidales bacterium]|nr:DUF3078 domain-containing protein [Bacteroidales bacterium]